MSDPVLPPPRPEYRPAGLKTPTPPWRGEADDRGLEWKLRAGAIPGALLIALGFHSSSIGHFLQRTFLSMMVHELGHAVTAWLCGYAALPLLWQTLTADRRGPILPLLVLSLCAYLVVRGRREEQSWLVALGVLLGAVELVGALLIAPRTAQMLITFGGDAGAMVIGTALMATFFFGRETQLYRGWLRWGFLVIGAAAFVDTFATWWSARHDYDAIPFGTQEGVGLSDPSRLIDVYGWSTRAMIHRYVTLGIVCLTCLAALWVWGVWRARREALAVTTDASD